MFLTINYDKERHRKDGKQGGLLGRPWFLTILWIAWALFVSWLNCWLTSGIKATQDWFHSPESYQFMDGTVNAQIFTTLHNGWAFSNFGCWPFARRTFRTYLDSFGLRVRSHMSANVSSEVL